MIRLEVKDYCQNCRAFEPDVEYPNNYLEATTIKDGTKLIHNTSDVIIRCACRSCCENLVNFIEKRHKENGNG